MGSPAGSGRGFADSPAENGGGFAGQRPAHELRGRSIAMGLIGPIAIRPRQFDALVVLPPVLHVISWASVTFVAAEARWPSVPALGAASVPSRLSTVDCRGEVSAKRTVPRGQFHDVNAEKPAPGVEHRDSSAQTRASSAERPQPTRASHPELSALTSLTRACLARPPRSIGTVCLRMNPSYTPSVGRDPPLCVQRSLQLTPGVRHV